MKIILAGGINKDNLKSFIDLKPDVIDVCSSLEDSPGNKSIKKLREFFIVYNKLEI